MRTCRGRRASLPELRIDLALRAQSLVERVRLLLRPRPCQRGELVAPGPGTLAVALELDGLAQQADRRLVEADAVRARHPLDAARDVGRHVPERDGLHL